MKPIFKTTLAALALTALASNASALELLDPMTVPGSSYAMFESTPDTLLSKTISFDKYGTVGIARVDSGRLISAPYGEMEDWTYLNKRTETKFAPISVGAHLKNIPAVAFEGNDSYNTLDEIRLTASDAGMDYVLVYGLDQDAETGAFAYRFIDETGFIVRDSAAAYKKAKAKAMLVDTHTGEVYGSVTADNVEFGVGELTDKVEDLIETLSAYGAA